MKPWVVPAVLAAVVGGVAVTILNYRPQTYQCQTRQVSIQNNEVTPYRTQAHLCDRLVITNHDQPMRLIAFGEHDHHVAYNGVTEKWLRSGVSLTVKLNQTGVFVFHDHAQYQVQGLFVVAK